LWIASTGIAAALAVRLSAQVAEPAWPDTFVSRLEALALMQTLNAQVLASRSATASLETWCRDRHLADDPRITAVVVKGADQRPSAEQRQHLEVSDTQAVNYRRVRLQCGTRVLAEADNWYVPARLTTEMNRLLETTETPFGTAVRPLEPYRQTLSVTMLWAPLPDGWERSSTALPADAPGRTLAMPEALFEHRAILYTRAHQPFAEVRETYRRDVLSFAPPK